MKYIRKSLLWILRLSITFGILYYIFTIVPFLEVIKSLISAKVSYMAAAFFTAFLMHYITAYRMKQLTDRQGISLSVLQILEIDLITNFYGLFLPGHLTGGAIRWYKLASPDNKWGEALASMGFNRLIDTLILVLLGILFWSLDIAPVSNDFIGFGMITILVGLVALYFIFFSNTVSPPLWKKVGKINFTMIPRLLQDRMGRLLISMSQYHNLPQRSLIQILGLSLGRHLLGTFSFYFFALSLGIDISFTSAGWVRSVTLILTMLPISFSGLGIREGVLIVLLQPYGVQATHAVALSFLSLGRRIIVAGIGGLLEAKNFILPAESKSEVKEIPL